jgi:hypothetical protein
MKANYDKIFGEILNVVSNGNTALRVMNVLKEQGLVTGEPTKRIQWIFNFQGGGWNTVFATTLKEAKKEVTKEYGTLKPMLDSVRPCADADYQAHLRNFD